MNFYGTTCSETENTCPPANDSAVAVGLCAYGTCQNTSETSTALPRYTCLCDAGYKTPEGSLECSVEQRCPPVHQIAVGSQAGANCDGRSVFANESTCQFYCESGYFLQGGDSVCTISGDWTIQPQCVTQMPTGTPTVAPTSTVVAPIGSSATTNTASKNMFAIAVGAVALGLCSLLIFLGIRYKRKHLHTTDVIATSTERSNPV